MEDHLEPLQKIQEQKPQVRVFAGHESEQTYEQIGDGLLEIVTDLIIPTPQHYIQVFNPTINDLILRSRILKNNRYERRKMTVICWNDQQQTTYTDVAISFLHQQHCDVYWKLICAKIGKNYLQINHNEKLDQPTENNLEYLLAKAKKSYNLVAFNLINSETFLLQFWNVFNKLHQEQNNKGISLMIKIFKQIMSHFDPTIMMVLLRSQNFIHFLRMFECAYITGLCTQTDLLNNYHNLGKFQKFVDMSDSLSQRIEIAIRARFFKDSITNQMTTGIDKIIRMTDDVLKQNYLIILNGILSQSIIDKIVQLQKTVVSTPGLQDTRETIFAQINMFFLQIFNLLWYLQSFKTKKSIIQLLLQPKAFQIFGSILNCGYFKILNVLSILAKQDSVYFFKAYKQNFRSNSNMSVNRLLAKQFAENPNSDITFQVINLLEHIVPHMREARENYDFFNGTFIVSVFSFCKNPYRLLTLSSFLLEKLDNNQSTIFTHIIRADLFQKSLAYTQYHKKQHKFVIFQLAKVIRAKLLACKKNRPSFVKQQQPQYKANKQCQEDKKAIDYIVSSGIVTQCLKYLSQNWQFNNLITGGIMQMLLIVSLMEYNSITKVINKFQFQLMGKSNTKAIQKYLKNIAEKKPKQDQNMGSGDEHDKSDHKVDQSFKQRIHHNQMQQEQYEMYLMREDEQADGIEKNGDNRDHLTVQQPIVSSNFHVKNTDNFEQQQQLAQLIRLRDEIRENKEKQQQEQAAIFKSVQRHHQAVIYDPEYKNNNDIQIHFNMPSSIEGFNEDEQKKNSIDMDF